MPSGRPGPTAPPALATVCQQPSQPSRPSRSCPARPQPEPRRQVLSADALAHRTPVAQAQAGRRPDRARQGCVARLALKNGLAQRAGRDGPVSDRNTAAVSCTALFSRPPAAAGCASRVAAAPICWIRLVQVGQWHGQQTRNRLTKKPPGRVARGAWQPSPQHRPERRGVWLLSPLGRVPPARGEAQPHLGHPRGHRHLGRGPRHALQVPRVVGVRRNGKRKVDQHIARGQRP
mmetsp:Transcript_28055/g.90716  ORF Transcript_28055/g.90716 Transcript_28055/m.90716 type:complete len:233 (-) Transcript_28055:487-1185(-)